MLLRKSGSNIEIMFRSKDFPARDSPIVYRHADTMSSIYHVMVRKRLAERTRLSENLYHQG